DVEEREHRLVGLLLHAQVVESVSRRRAPGQRLPRSRSRRTGAQKVGGVAAEQPSVAALVGRVQEVEPAQERIGRRFRCAKQIASAVELRLAEAQQFVRATVRIAPDPPMNAIQHGSPRRGLHTPRPGRALRCPRMSRRVAVVETALALTGAAMVACALAANQEWLDRHFLPDFFIPRATFLRAETTARVAVAALGLLMASIGRRPLARFLTRDPIRTALVAIAIAASFGAAEVVLRRSHLRAKEEVPARKEPRRHLDARLGWLFVPSRAGS